MTASNNILGVFRAKHLSGLLATLAFCSAFAQRSEAQLSLTEKLIQREVIERGGDWEGSDSCGLVSFSGKEFTNEHFELLAHVRGIEWFHVNDLVASKESLRWLYGQDRLVKLDLFSSGDLPNGLHLVGRRVLSRLEQFRVSGVNLSNEAAETIGSMTNLKVLVLDDVSLTPNGLAVLSKCKHLESLDADLRELISDEVTQELRKRLPNCEISITYSHVHIKEVGSESDSAPKKE